MKHPIFNLPVLFTAVLCLAATAIISAMVFNPPLPPTRMLDQPLPAPSFNVIDDRDQTVTDLGLYGTVWVCDFFLTRCKGICPILGDTMAQLAWELEQDPKLQDVRLISFSVDPEHDRPEQLRQYRAQYTPSWANRLDTPDQYEPRLAAIDKYWRHVTPADNEQQTWWDSIENSFHLMVGPADADDTSTPIAHASKLVLIDQQGRIRGYYEGLNPDESIEPLIADIRRLLDEN